MTPMEHDGEGIVADGQDRLRATDWYQERAEEIEAAIAQKYGEELARAGWVTRWLVRLKMRREIERELEKLAPSGALYVRG